MHGNRGLAAAGALLLVAYASLSLLLDPGGYLGTDTGAKVATLDAMAQSGSWHPEVGYWAEQWDPQGSVHPLFDTRLIGGRWVNVTTLPMLLAALPLYELGGYRLALLLPMLGAVATAFCARALALRLGRSRPEAMTIFWLVGLASPATIYALDFWEHSIGLALMVGGITLLAGRLRADPGFIGVLGAGVCFGAAATMRNEALVYAAVAVGAAALCHALRRRFRSGVLVGVAATIGFAVPWLMNAALESTLGGQARSTRVSGVTSSASTSVGDADELSLRASEAIRTTFDLGASGDRAMVVTGILVGLAIACVGYLGRSRWTLVQGLACLVLAIYAVRWLESPSFVSGFIAAFPVAAAALVFRRRDLSEPARYLLVVALGALPLVWAFQYTGGAGPQWGGRYVLTSAIILGTVGAAKVIALERRWVQVPLFVSCVAITALGVAWAAERTHAIADGFEELAEAPEDVIIVPNGFFVREGGAAALERRFLSLGRGAFVDDAVSVARKAGLDSFAILDSANADDSVPKGSREVGQRSLDILGVNLVLRSYRFTD